MMRRGVDQIGEHEIDEPVVSAEWDRGLGPVGGERKQPSPLAPGEDDGENVHLLLRLGGV